MHRERKRVAGGSAWRDAARLILLSACALPAPGAWAQVAAAPAPAAPAPAAGEAAAEAKEAAEEGQDEILVTAHRQHGAVLTEVPPEVSIGSAAVRALGAADLNEVFEDLAPEIRSGENLPAGGAEPTIVLVNGQRIAGFASIRDFPPEAVRRIEIFPEQVALEYGYGPNQRVVNVVLRSDYRALTLLGRYTVAPDNWRGIYRGKADLLRIGEDSHWNLDLDYGHEDPIYAKTTLAGPPGQVGLANPPAYTTAAQSDHLAVSGGATRVFGGVTAEFTGRLELTALQSRLGLADEDGALLASEGGSALVTAPLDRLDRTAMAQANLTLNGTLARWRWSFVGRLDETTRETVTTPSEPASVFDSILLPSPGLIGRRCGTGASGDCVSTDQRNASGRFYLNGALFSLPAGAVTTALSAGFGFSGVRAASLLSGRDDLTRDEGDVQANLTAPVTSARSPIGKLALGVNGAAHRVSDFGTLATLGSTLDWSPVRPVALTASLNREQQAPSLLQLGQATLDTPDVREFDFVADNTTIVQRIEGGTADLRATTSRVARVRLQVTPLRSADLTLSAEYSDEHLRDPIASVTAATAATMAAFPDHFTRDVQGYLTALDARPVNLAREDREQVRWGLNYTLPFGRSAAAPGSTKAPARSQIQIALYDTWRLRDTVLLRAGQRSLDLLGDDIISDTGGTPTHEVELQTTVATGAWSANVNGVWSTPTTAAAGAAGDRLTFTQGVRLNLRLQLNLADAHWLTRALPFLHGSLNLSADNLLGAHVKVHDASGAVPLAYAESYLNPTGRTFRLTLRKRFR